MIYNITKCNDFISNNLASFNQFAKPLIGTANKLDPIVMASETGYTRKYLLTLSKTELVETYLEIMYVKANICKYERVE